MAFMKKYEMVEAIKCPCYVGTYKTDDAQELARLLRKGGFRVRLRGRGQRNFEGKGTSYKYQAYVPIIRAKICAVYITGKRSYYND